MKVTDKYVFFWKEHPFCNFTKCVIEYKGKQFTSSEQLFMWMKADFFDDDETAAKILRTNEPEVARKLGRLVKNYDDAEWDKVRVGSMFEAVLEKFRQNENLKKQLCDHKYDDKQFVEAAYYDRIWGIGYNENDALNTPESKWGRNELGKILNRVRDFLKDINLFKRLDYLGGVVYDILIPHSPKHKGILCDNCSHLYGKEIEEIFELNHSLPVFKELFLIFENGIDMENEISDMNIEDKKIKLKEAYDIIYNELLKYGSSGIEELDELYNLTIENLQ